MQNVKAVFATGAARGRRKQAKPQRKNAASDEPDSDIVESSMKEMTLKPAAEEMKLREDDANHNHINGVDDNCSKPHIQGPPNLETILRRNNGTLRKHPNGVRKSGTPSLQHLLRENTNGEYAPCLNTPKTPVISVKPFCALNNNSGSDWEEDAIHDLMRARDTGVVFPESIGHRTKVPSLSPSTAVKALSDSEPVSDYTVKCPQCQASFHGFQQLQEHIETEHPRPASPRDEKFSPTLSSGVIHPCAPCNVSFPSKDQLEKHELLHSPNAQVSCKVCNKQFANVYRLQRHMISHDESAVLRKFKCPECEKAFKFKHHLKEHIRIHSGEKPFECANCGKKFSHSGSYSSHMTSKKCLVMNLKVSRGRALAMDKPPMPRGMTPRKTTMKGSFHLRPGNGGFPLLPKYADGGGMFSAVSPRTSFAPPSSTPTHLPFYMGAAPSMPPIHPYSLPALSHFLEQLAAPMAPKIEEMADNEEIEVSAIKEEYKEEAEDAKQEDKDRSSPHSNAGNDLEAVKRILDTVNATVTKQLLEANMLKFTSSPSGSSSLSPSSDARKDEIDCRHCGKAFSNRIEHHQHERYLCECLAKSEGLAAKLEEVASEKSANGACSSDEDEGKDGEVEDEGIAITTQESADGRKVRVRSLIADEHLAVLKHHYMVNPRPKREELSRIADKIGFPVRVVQVWFQNTRARDRREGRLLQVPGYHPLFNNNVPLLASALEQPLDLSTKKSRSVSPGAGTEAEVMNLSRRPSSPRPHVYSNGLTSRPGFEMPRRTPSPLAYLNLHQDEIAASHLSRMFSHPSHFGSNGINSLPLERLVFNHDLHMKSENGRALSSSPGSDKRSWRQGDLTSETEDSVPADSEAMDDIKRARFGRGICYPGSDPEGEGQFICDQCDKAFSKQSSLARHKYEHSGQRPHKCEVCNKAFKHKHHLTEHRRLHTGEKPFKCEKCLKKFSHSGSYSQHMNHRYSYCKPYRE